jgi:hypothetical protein
LSYKKHGIEGAKEPRVKGRGRARAQRPSAVRPNRAAGSPIADDADHRTQRVTEADVRGGRIRIPRGPTKGLFPTERTDVELEMRGERFSARWDPRYVPSQERSGVLGIGRERLARLVATEEIMRVSAAGGVLRLD